MSALITADLVTLDENIGEDRFDVIRHLAGRIVDTGRADSLDGLYSDAKARESKTDTGIPGGIAIPHCRSASVQVPSLGMARLNPGVDFGAKDGPADLIFFIAAPDGADQEHLQLLSKLARSLMKKDFKESLRQAQSRQDVVDLVNSALGLDASGEPAAAAGATPSGRAGEGGSTAAAGGAAGTAAGGAAAGAATAGAATAGGAATGADTTPGTPPDVAPGADADAAAQGAAPARKRLVAVTSCPTGIAHTYMAADALSMAAEEKGVQLDVETQGSSGNEVLSPATIEAADAVIFAASVDVRDRERFAGLPVIESPVKRGIDEPGVMIDEALAAAENPNARRVSGDRSSAEASSSEAGWGSRLYKSLMTGVSYMIPFVAAGGLLIAISFLISSIVGSGSEIANTSGTILGIQDGALTGDGATLFNTGDVGFWMYIAAVLNQIGGLALGLLVPALAGFIAFGMAGRPGIAPGFAAGLTANLVGAGFLGGIVGGLLAGLFAYWLAKPKLPRWLAGMMPVVIIPLIATALSSGLLFLVLGQPIAWVLTALNDFLLSMSGASAIVLGLILGGMMGADLGGPINKAAYLFATAGLAEGTEVSKEIMAAVIAGGMVAPLAMALATTIGKRYFTPAEVSNGRAAWLLGASFISEGAIPFAAADPLRVIPSSIVGSAVAGAICLSSGVASPAPHGGVWITLLVTNWPMYLVAVVVGMVVTALLYLLLKRISGAKTGAEKVKAAGVA
ncbi:fructose-specific PTS transporter subunit EIIC [Rothia sp. AR01]|uniref:Fructose-specific PTS transporter subunit EIIC n=1 Tax=Rothia santali TaxID=2949643 RepID=A0A9X2HAY7_9MICC|nr:fructose-specific PTS transporter subunit EIIC [Rothia santali]MCP3426299.1 fructose-specific PTS transporter subunit EIIC [Rothia santali]